MLPCTRPEQGKPTCALGGRPHSDEPPRHAVRCSAELAAQLRALESKLLHGEQRGGLDNLAQQTAARLSQQELELSKARAADVAAARRIAALEASTHAAQTRYSSLQVGVTWGHVQAHRPALHRCDALLYLPQDESEALTAQLETAATDYEAARAELGDVYARWERERDGLVEEIRCDVRRCQALRCERHTRRLWSPAPRRSLHHSLALKSLVVDAFIPQQEVSKARRPRGSMGLSWACALVRVTRSSAVLSRARAAAASSGLC